RSETVRRRGRVLAVLFGLALVIVVACWLALPILGSQIRSRVRAAVSAATGLPVATEDFKLALLPPAIEVGRVTVGDPSSPALQLFDVRTQLDLGASVSWVHPAVSATVGRLEIDTRRWPSERP